MHSHFLKIFLKETLQISGCCLFLKKWNNEIVVINITPLYNFNLEVYPPRNLKKNFAPKTLANFKIKSPHYNGRGGQKPCQLAHDLLNFQNLYRIKVGLLSSKKIYFICFNESSLKLMKNDFYFIFKALFVLKISKFLSKPFGHMEKTVFLNLVKKQLQFTYYPLLCKVKIIRQWTLVI